jgi:3-hexulose-6-phosphate synthase
LLNGIRYLYGVHHYSAMKDRKNEESMNLQISYDFTNLTEAIEVAKKTAAYADILEVGTPLLLAEGLKAAEAFKKEFPDKKILADTKLVDRVDEIIECYGKIGIDYITVLGSTTSNIIRKVTTLAHKYNINVVLDLIDIHTFGQAAKDAAPLDIDTVLFHTPYDAITSHDIEDKWELVHGNTKLPIFVGEKTNLDSIKNLLSLKPDGILIGTAITKAANPEKAAKEFSELIHQR